MSSNASALATLGNIFVDPRKAFEDIKGHNAWLWLPLALVIIATVASVVAFYSHADTAAMMQAQLAASGQHPTPEQMQAMAKFQSPMFMMISSSIGSAVGIVVVYLIIALYYMLVAKVGGWNEQRYGSWLSFTVWSGFPAILAPLITLIVVLVRGGVATRFAQGDVTSLNALLLHLPMSNPWYMLAAGISPFSVWALVLAIYGLTHWTRRGWGYSALVVLVPTVVFYGLIIAFKALV